MSNILRFPLARRICAICRIRFHAEGKDDYHCAQCKHWIRAGRALGVAVRALRRTR